MAITSQTSKRSNSIRYFVSIFLLMMGLQGCNYPGISQGSTQTSTPDLAGSETAAVQETLDAFVTDSHQTETAQLAQASGTAQALDATQQAQNVAASATALELEAQSTLGALDATAAFQAILATSQAQTANAPPPTATLPPPTPTPEMMRINFGSGATSAHLEGSLLMGESDYYVIRALKDQTMMVDVFSGTTLHLGVVGLADGFPLLQPSAEKTSFRGKLPSTQDYRIRVIAPYAASNYTLQVAIPVRVQFPPGATSAIIQGKLASQETNYYLAWAQAGQTMHVKITSPGNDVLLTVYGFEDGMPLIRYVSGDWEWSGVLPASQDYMIHAVSVGGATTYQLEVSIE